SHVSYSLRNGQLTGGKGMPEPLYWVALASDEAVPDLPAGVLEQPIDETEVVRAWGKAVGDRDADMGKLRHLVETQDMQLAEHRQYSDSLANQVQQLNNHVGQLVAHSRAAERTVAELHKK